MKRNFSNKWKASRQTRKQRKYAVNAPLNVRHNLMSSHLSKDLRKKYSRRSFPLKKGDKVIIMKGEFRKKTGKIDIVDYDSLKVTIESMQQQKKDGTKVNIKFDPSNLMIIEFNMEDKKRIESIERGKKNISDNKTGAKK